jgi:hypothetical protein
MSHLNRLSDLWDTQPKRLSLEELTFHIVLLGSGHFHDNNDTMALNPHRIHFRGWCTEDGVGLCLAQKSTHYNVVNGSDSKFLYAFPMSPTQILDYHNGSKMSTNPGQTGTP